MFRTGHPRKAEDVRQRLGGALGGLGTELLENSLQYGPPNLSLQTTFRSRDACFTRHTVLKAAYANESFPRKGESEVVFESEHYFCI